MKTLSPEESLNFYIENGRDSFEWFWRNALGAKFISNHQLELCKALDEMVAAQCICYYYDEGKDPWTQESIEYSSLGYTSPPTKKERELSEKFGISIHSGKGTGKTSAAGAVIIWWITCFKESEMLCTAPTKPQLKIVLWRAAAEWLNKLETKIIVSERSLIPNLQTTGTRSFKKLRVPSCLRETS